MCRARAKRAAGPRASCSSSARLRRPASPNGHEATEEDAPRRDAPDAASLGDGVALVRRVLGEATTPPRWPMYPRQFKQFLKTAQPDFEERRYGSIADLMRACQKDGILRLERDRQGGLRVFANGATSSRASVPHGWGLVVNNPQPPADAVDPAELVEPLPPVVADPVVVAEELGVAAEPAKPKRATRARKTAAPARRLRRRRSRQRGRRRLLARDQRSGIRDQRLRDQRSALIPDP